MALDPKQPKDVDLDQTDKLPVLEGVLVDADVEDDAVRLEHTAILSVAPAIVSQPAQPDFGLPVDLPSLAESVRSVEERIARQSAEYQGLSRLYEKARDAESTAVARANALAADLSAAQSALAVEQHRSRELDRTLTETNASMEAMRERLEEALRASEQTRAEARTMRDALAARDATIVEIIPALEARSKANAQLEAELNAERQQREAIALELKSTQESVTTLRERLTHGEAEWHAARQQLSAEKHQSAAYLEALRTREWRVGFNQTLFLEWDADMDLARADPVAAQTERDRLRQTAAVLNGKLAEQGDVVAKLERTAEIEAKALSQKSRELEESERARAELAARIDALESEQKRWQGELAARDQTFAEAEKRHAEERAQISLLRAEAENHEGELAVLMAHLNEARRPIQSIEADIKRLTDELALKTSSIAQLDEDNRRLRAALERSESHSANVLGRIQTSIERLGTAAVPIQTPASAPELSAEFVRVDGKQDAYPIARRTRIGRAPDCNLRIDSTAVSRHHAILLKGTRELIIEDLNSTNGVMVNGRKTSRQQLNDGDLVTIGDVQFRCVLKFAPAPPEPAP